MASGHMGSANERLKRSFRDWFWGSVIVAVLFHFTLFACFPALHAADVSFSADEIVAIDIPPELEIPPPPEQISRPAMPIIGSTDIADDITIAETTFADNPVETLPPPSPTTTRDDDLAAVPRFTPMTVRPRMLNAAEVEHALIRTYPPMLRDVGIGGSAEVWFFIDREGHVARTLLHTSSGYLALDQAALDVAKLVRFSPAENRGEKVAVWVSLPITFTSK